MPNAIMPNETAKPKKDNVVMVLNVLSLAIEEIVFMLAPFLALGRALREASLEQKTLCGLSGDR
jgi:hypothetical protein